MKFFEITSLYDLENKGLDEVDVMLMLNCCSNNKKEMLECIDLIEHEELVIAISKRDNENDSYRKQIFKEINRRCEKSKINTLNTVVLFRIRDCKINFKSKRFINVTDALKYEISNSESELMLLIANNSSSFDSLKKEIIRRIDGENTQYEFGISTKLEIKIRKSDYKKQIYKRIVSV